MVFVELSKVSKHGETKGTTGEICLSQPGKCHLLRAVPAGWLDQDHAGDPADISAWLGAIAKLRS